MNKVIITLVAVLVSFTVLHSGKTDSHGGHYNHSTGEYHYHHGYSAHDHYDMDGDGIVDCPYSFKDNTNKSNSESSDNKKHGSTRIAIYTILAYGIMFLPWAIKEVIKKVIEKYKYRK